MDDVDLLAGSELFSGFDGDALRALVERSRALECERNVSLFQHGSDGKLFFNNA